MTSRTFSILATVLDNNLLAGLYEDAKGLVSLTIECDNFDIDEIVELFGFIPDNCDLDSN
jgi:hypothetical protein